MKHTILILLLSLFLCSYAQDQKSCDSYIVHVCSSNSSISFNTLLIRNLDQFSHRLISLPKNIVSVLGPWAALYHHKFLNNFHYTKEIQMIFTSSSFADFFLSGSVGSLRKSIEQFFWSCKDVVLVLLTILVFLDTLSSQTKTILIGLLFANEIAGLLKDILCYTLLYLSKK